MKNKTLVIVATAALLSAVALAIWNGFQESSASGVERQIRDLQQAPMKAPPLHPVRPTGDFVRGPNK